MLLRDDHRFTAQAPIGNEVYADAVYLPVGLAQYGMQQAGLIPTVEGFDYLEFAEYLFTHDIQELQALYQPS